MIAYSRPKRSDLYTLCQNKLLENHTLHSGTYLYSPYMAVPPPPPPSPTPGSAHTVWLVLELPYPCSKLLVSSGNWYRACLRAFSSQTLMFAPKQEQRTVQVTWELKAAIFTQNESKVESIFLLCVSKWIFRHEIWIVHALAFSYLVIPLKLLLKKYDGNCFN